MDEAAAARPPWTLIDLLKGGAAAFALAVAAGAAAFGLGADETDPLVNTIGVSAFYILLVFLERRFALSRRGAGWAEAGFRSPGPRLLPRIIGWYVVGLFAQGLAFAVTGPLFGESPGAEEQLGLPGPDVRPVLAIAIVIAAVIVAPVAEEFVFRGLLYRYLRARVPISAAMVLTSLLFAVAHVFLPLIPALFALGMVLNFVAERYDSLYPSIGIHMLQNGLAVGILFLA